MAITSTSPKVAVTASKLVPRKEKYWILGVSKLFKSNLTFLNVRLVIGDSTDIFLAFCFFMGFFSVLGGFLYCYGVER